VSEIFVETKKAVIGEGSKVPHLSYIGDAKLGFKNQHRAGTISCNYDGVNQYQTSIGNRFFIGSIPCWLRRMKIEMAPTSPRAPRLRKCSVRIAGHRARPSDQQERLGRKGSVCEMAASPRAKSRKKKSRRGATSLNHAEPLNSLAPLIFLARSPSKRLENGSGAC